MQLHAWKRIILDLMSKKYLEKGVISILSTGQWHFINDPFDGDKTHSKWKRAVEESLLNNFLPGNSSKERLVD